jgi:hypothetical protein
MPVLLWKCVTANLKTVQSERGSSFASSADRLLSGHRLLSGLHAGLCAPVRWAGVISNVTTRLALEGGVIRYSDTTSTMTLS